MVARIGHIAIFSENPTDLAKFYGEVFGTKTTGVDDLGNAGSPTAIWISRCCAAATRRRRRSASIISASPSIRPSGRRCSPDEEIRHRALQPLCRRTQGASSLCRGRGEGPDGQPLRHLDRHEGCPRRAARPAAASRASGRPSATSRCSRTTAGEKLAKFYGECFGMESDRREPAAISG